MEKIDLFVTDEDPDLKRSGSAGSDLPEEEDPDLDPADLTTLVLARCTSFGRRFHRDRPVRTG